MVSFNRFWVVSLDRFQQVIFCRFYGVGFTVFSNITSNTKIPVYYDYSYSDKLYETKITFDSINTTNDKYTIMLENNHDNEANWRQQFRGNDKKFSLKDEELTKHASLSLTFSGWIPQQLSCSSLIFCSENKGCSSFDMVFFKDFPWFVRYIVTSFIIMIMIALWLRLGKFVEKREEKSENKIIESPAHTVVDETPKEI